MALSLLLVLERLAVQNTHGRYVNGFQRAIIEAQYQQLLFWRKDEAGNDVVVFLLINLVQDKLKRTADHFGISLLDEKKHILTVRATDERVGGFEVNLDFHQIVVYKVEHEDFVLSGGEDHFGGKFRPAASEDVFVRDFQYQFRRSEVQVELQNEHISFFVDQKHFESLVIWDYLLDFPQSLVWVAG